MKRLRFWAMTVGAVLGIGVTLDLGFWQLGRGQERQALQAAIESRRSQPPLPGSVLSGGEPLAALLHRPVLLKGRWMPRHTVYLDNRQMQGKPGFYVVTPLQPAGGGPAVLVQRGWVQRNFLERDRVPAIETPEGEVEVLGRIAPPPAKLYDLGEAQAGPIRQNLDLDAFAAEVGVTLVPASVVEMGPPSQNLLRDWPEVGSAAAKNYGYAVQWWALAALIVILYVWFQFIAPRRERA
jgi:surfeit locus 1 family protein